MCEAEKSLSTVELADHTGDELPVGDGVAQALLGDGRGQHPEEFVVGRMRARSL